MPSRFFEGHPQLFVRQRKELAEILVDWETRNQYEILDRDQALVGTVAERASGLGGFLRRGFLRSHRGFEIRVIDREGALVLELERSFFFLFSDLAVRAAGGDAVGRVKRRFGILYKRYDLLDERGQLFGRVRGPRWRIWTFPIESTRGTGDAVVSKKWGGVLREVFADADTFRVDFGTGTWSPTERALIFAAAISIDFDFFENNQGRRGGLLRGRD